MRHGGRLTLALSTLLAVLLVAGATAAWSVGRHRQPATLAGYHAGLAGYHAGPTADHTVLLSVDAGNHPRAGDVQSLLQRYFDAINNRDYGSWASAVAAEQSAPENETTWIGDYATTVDSNLSVVTIADDPMRARTVFTSEQAVGSAPPSLPVTCINWDVTYLLAERNGRLVVVGIDPSAQSMTACG